MVYNLLLLWPWATFSHLAGAMGDSHEPARELPSCRHMKRNLGDPGAHGLSRDVHRTCNSSAATMVMDVLRAVTASRKDRILMPTSLVARSAPAEDSKVVCFRHLGSQWLREAHVVLEFTLYTVV